MADTGRRLLIIERAYRGSVETQFADVLYFVRELNRQQGGMDILLRGLAVTFAAAHPAPVPALRIAGRRLDTLPDPRETIRTLVSEGAGVWAQDSALAEFETGPDWLQKGVRRASDATFPDWAGYLSVHFL
ncbi:hypothetical protein [Streptomyces albipurpureus]|uniref:Uncharacterized protein n=1 Tax=Streptomyces albipurpureus TaxID=2897419 RepID=A0ABT0UIE4_9ACTN|nr:hypothetical protein [Streptomyces sp. CWNU-1]MCM2387936.1 hypothetical protein [Streptomyces sp. CWNU-1]